jgi:hypothetical protein
MKLTYYGPDFTPVYDSNRVLKNDPGLKGFDSVDWRLFSETVGATLLQCNADVTKSVVKISTEVGCDPVSAQYPIAVCKKEGCSTACGDAVKAFQFACETIPDCKGHAAPQA